MEARRGRRNEEMEDEDDVAAEEEAQEGAGRIKRGRSSWSGVEAGEGRGQGGEESHLVENLTKTSYCQA